LEKDDDEKKKKKNPIDTEITFPNTTNLYHFLLLPTLSFIPFFFRSLFDFNGKIKHSDRTRAREGKWKENPDLMFMTRS
jgi:hypothetical protein